MGAEVKAILRAAKDGESLKALGANIVTADFDEHISLVGACKGSQCVVSALSGMTTTIKSRRHYSGSTLEGGRGGWRATLQSLALLHRLQPIRARPQPQLRPAKRVSALRSSLDPTKATRRQSEANQCISSLSPPAVTASPHSPSCRPALSLLSTPSPASGRSSTRAACVGRPFFNGGFAYLLVTRGFIDRQNRKVLFCGEDDGVQVDYTTLDDLAAFNARVALDPEAPRSLHTARVTKSPRQLAEHASSLTGQRYGTLRCGSLAELRAQIKTLFEVDPDPEAHGLPMWQAMQSRTSIPGLVGVLKTTTSATASYHGPPSTTSWRR